MLGQKNLLLLLVGVSVSWTFFTFPKLPTSMVRDHTRSTVSGFFGNELVQRGSSPKASPKMMAFRLFASVDSEEDVEVAEGMPDKGAFSKFFQGSAKVGGEIGKAALMAYSAIASMLDDGLIYADDVDDLWSSAVGDAKGLNEDEAYEMLCMISDLPDPEDVAFYDKEFQQISGGKDTITFFQVLSWEDVKSMISEEALTMEQISEAWRTVGGDLNAKLTRAQFSKLNKEIDDMIEEDPDEEGEEDGEEDGDEAATDANMDAWDPAFDPLTVFDDSALGEIKDYFVSRVGSVEGSFKYTDLEEWSDIKEMLADAALTPDALQVAWAEAAQGKSSIDYNRFLRLNVRLDLLMDEIEAAAEATATETPAAQAPAAPPAPAAVATTAPAAPADEGSDADPEQYYKSEFYKVTEGGPLMRLDMLLEWEEVAELVKDGAVTESQIQKLFDGMPREPMGIPATSVGITQTTFMAFNSMLDILLDASAPAVKGAPRVGVTPSTLVEATPMPKPKDAELKMGSIGSLPLEGDDSADTGLSEMELQMMQMLDQADNMLNSGSYGDFDQLIGDINDPRLTALREKRDGAQEVAGQLRDIIDELLVLGNGQSRCGLDRPSEEDAARLRDLMQAVIEKTPSLADNRDILDMRQQINGKWKLLYSNSEMFEFYNGVTGFANVFPASKFQDLAVEYTSDGYLSEARYLERLSSPLGVIDATVFANWDLVKEMSFMTNANSLVLRNYCTKVTAGPMEYEAQENWKSLRTLSMNEVVYVDDRIQITRNCGALRIYFLFARQQD
ncbi:hypothetical protein B484DRAFT_452471 [Ochromonadaceae sp. CCMP2298]|nr:hypothetical protein B484DRAFT_452471 [Ochromonadaceae sp. CCMP2298]